VVATGDKFYSADFNQLVTLTLQRPLVRLIQQAAQSIANTADVPLTFGAGSEDIDTHGFHDTSTNNTRITPTVPGYYQLNGNVWWSNDGDVVSYHSAIARNGSVVARNRILLGTSTALTSTRSHLVTAILSANGSGDYFELIGQQTQNVTGSLSTNAAGSFSSTFECIYLRPL
jgi:hypothetical protein